MAGINGMPLRIVSLIASATEIVCALGLENAIVGRSHECDFPASITSLPACTSPKFDVEGLSYEIDQRVKAIVQEGLSVYRVDARMLDELSPSHIITQSQCEVCAVSLRDVEKAVCQLTSSHPAIVSLEPNSLADVWSDIKRVGDALGVEERAAALIKHLENRMMAIKERAESAIIWPRVAFIEWMNPLMAGGNWIPELIEMAGGLNLFGEAGRHSPFMDWSELAASDPDVIIISPCGFDIKRTLTEIEYLRGLSGWTDLKAVRNHRVVIADGNSYFSRPGPRLVESLEILAEVVHPDLFDFGHGNTGWEREAPTWRD
jgi:iron complex transport system substrate-binding protein